MSVEYAGEIRQKSCEYIISYSVFTHPKKKVSQVRWWKVIAVSCKILYGDWSSSIKGKWWYVDVMGCLLDSVLLCVNCKVGFQCISMYAHIRTTSNPLLSHHIKCCVVSFMHIIRFWNLLRQALDFPASLVSKVVLALWSVQYRLSPSTTWLVVQLPSCHHII